MDNDFPRSERHQDKPARMTAAVGSGSPADDPSVSAAAVSEHDAANPVIEFVQKNPLLAVAAAVVIGAGVAAVLTPRRGPTSSLDAMQRDLRRYSRNMQRKVDREYRASGAADAVSQIAAALPSVDLKHVVDRMSELATGALETARKRLNV